MLLMYPFSFIWQDFFGKPAFLTVSGQLNAETYATALSDVYLLAFFFFFLMYHNCQEKIV